MVDITEKDIVAFDLFKAPTKVSKSDLTKSLALSFSRSFFAWRLSDNYASYIKTQELKTKYQINHEACYRASSSWVLGETAYKDYQVILKNFIFPYYQLRAVNLAKSGIGNFASEVINYKKEFLPSARVYLQKFLDEVSVSSKKGIIINPVVSGLDFYSLFGGQDDSKGNSFARDFASFSSAYWSAEFKNNYKFFSTAQPYQLVEEFLLLVVEALEFQINAIVALFKPNIRVLASFGLTSDVKETISLIEEELKENDGSLAEFIPWKKIPGKAMVYVVNDFFNLSKEEFNNEIIKVLNTANPYLNYPLAKVEAVPVQKFKINRAVEGFNIEDIIRRVREDQEEEEVPVPDRDALDRVNFARLADQARAAEAAIAARFWEEN